MTLISQIVPARGVGVAGAPGRGLNWVNAGWATATAYAVDDALEHGGSSYRCIVSHTSSALLEPGIGASWATYWEIVALSSPPTTLSDADIKAAYERNSNTNAFTDLLLARLNGSGASQSVFASRVEATGFTVDASVQMISVIHDGKACHYVRGSANSALTTNGGTVQWKPAFQATFGHWGAIGDWNGTTGTNSTTAINSALAWWIGANSRELYIPEGWFRYDGTTTLDGENVVGKWTMFNKLHGPGRISFGSSQPVAWIIQNIENVTIDVNIRGGGTRGDFRQIAPTGGGTTAIKIFGNLYCTLNIKAFKYLGRVLHLDSHETDQFKRSMRVNCTVNFGSTGNVLTQDDNDRVGQPLYVNTRAISNIGGTGHFNVKGRGCWYGPIFERLNDVEFGVMECGDFFVLAPVLRGIRALKANYWWTGEVNAGANACPGFLAEAAHDGTKNYGWNFDTLQILGSNTGAGAYLSAFSGAGVGLPCVRIGQLGISQASGAGLYIDNVLDSVNIENYSCHGADNGVVLEGVNGDIDIKFNNFSSCTGHAVQNLGTGTDSVTIRGQIRGGISGKNLINLGSSNNTHFVIDAHLESSVCGRLIDWTHTNTYPRITHINGSVITGGSTTIYPTSKQPRIIANVLGHTNTANRYFP